MGFFFNNVIKPLKEAEVDGQPAEETAEQPADYTAEEGSGDNQPAETQTDTETPADDAGQNSEPPQDDQGGEEPPMDYTDMDSGAEGEEGTDDTGEGSSDSTPEEDQPVDEIKQQEEELYANLTPEQLDIKHKELKSQFLAMYDMIVSVLDRIGDVSIAEENIGIMEYVSNNLSRLKDMITDYMNSVYKTKSYTENSVNYNRFLAVLNGITKILEEMNKKED